MTQTMTKTETILDYALMYYRLGFSVIPLKYGDKKPAIKTWKPYQEKRPTEEEIRKWFTGKKRNIAIITGRVSNNLVVIDFDNEKLFKKFISKIREKRSEIFMRLKEALANTWIIKTGKGYHIYVKLEDPELVPRTKPRLLDGLDIKAEGGYIVAPPSLHPSGKKYEFIINNDGELFGPPNIPEPITLTKKEWEKLLSIIVQEKTEKELTGLLLAISHEHKEKYAKKGDVKELSDSQIVEIKELLKLGYRRGHRQYICLFISGWGAWARINPLQIAKIVKMLHEETNDEERLGDRLSTILYSYYKVWVKQWGNKWAELYRYYEEKIREVAKEWGVSRISEPSEYSSLDKLRVSGKSGLQEHLEETVGGERALEVIRRIEEIFNTASPFRDSVFKILDYEKQLYAIANLRKLIVVRGVRKGDRIIYKEEVTIGAPTKVIVYINPLGGITKYEVVWEVATRPRPIRIGPATFEDIVARLKAEKLVENHRLVRDVLSAVLEGYILKGRAEIKEEIESPGFYWVDGKIVTVRWEVKDVAKEELKEALMLLDELAKWFSHAIDRFSTVVKWGLIAPFSYIYKQRGKWIKWLYLYGSSKTGKTTLGEIIMNIWGLDSRFRKSGSAIDTVARIGHVLSQSTFPVLVNEPGGAIYKEDVIELMKSAIESPHARAKYIKGTYTDIPSLAPLILTSNKTLPRDDALLRRLLVLRFTFGERIDDEKAKEFDEKVKPKLGKLAAIGYWVAKKIIEDPSLLGNEWDKLAEKLLEDMYHEAGLAAPAWIKAQYEAEDNIYDDIRESIRNYLIKRINEEYTRFVGRVVVTDPDDPGARERYLYREEIDFEKRVKIVLEKRLLPWAILRGEKIVFTTGFANEIRNIIGDIGGLRSIAELLGWEYKRGVKIEKRTVQGIIVSFNDLIDFLTL